MSSALVTIDDYVADARVLLLDTIAPYRYTDAELVIAMNVTLLEGRRLRPDLFVYYRWPNRQNGVQSLTAVDGTVVQIEEQFRLAFLHGMLGHALQRDQEDIQDQRSALYMSIFTSMLVGRAQQQPPPAQAQGQS